MRMLNKRSRLLAGIVRVLGRGEEGGLVGGRIHAPEGRGGNILLVRRTCHYYLHSISDFVQPWVMIQVMMPLR